MTNKRRCQGRNANGEPCGAPPTRDSRYCYFHDPELAEARESAQQIGRGRRKRDASLAVIYEFTTLSTVEGKLQYLDIAAHDALALDSSVARVRAMGSLVQTSIKVDEHTDMKEDIQALKAAVFGRKNLPEASVYDADHGSPDSFPADDA